MKKRLTCMLLFFAVGLLPLLGENSTPNNERESPAKKKKTGRAARRETANFLMHAQPRPRAPNSPPHGCVTAPLLQLRKASTNAASACGWSWCSMWPAS